MHPLNVATIVGAICVLAFAVMLIQPENMAKSEDHEFSEMNYDESSNEYVEHGEMTKHHAMIKSLIHEKHEHTISVTGFAQKNIEPDLLVMEFGVETNGDTAKLALNSNSKLLSDAISKLELLGISENELNTSKFTITPLYDYYQDEETGRHMSELIGYRVTNLLQVKTTHLDSAALILDSLVSSGINKVNSVYFTISPESYSIIHDSLIEDAIQNAKTKSITALLPLNQKIVGVKSINLDAPITHSSSSMNVKSSFLSESTMYDAPIFTSNTVISASVHVVFLIDENIEK